jgi:serine/threonine protein kinase
VDCGQDDILSTTPSPQKYCVKIADMEVRPCFVCLRSEYHMWVDNSQRKTFCVWLLKFASNGVTPEYMTYAGTPNWTAPEILLGTAEVSGATDVYALANVLFEIATRTLPFSEEFDPTAVAEHIKAGRRPTWPPCPALEAASGSDERAKLAACELLSHSQLKALVFRAWSQDPSERPSAAALAKELERMLADFIEQLNQVHQDRLFRSASLSVVSKDLRDALLSATQLNARRKSIQKFSEDAPVLEEEISLPSVAAPPQQHFQEPPSAGQFI